MVITHCGLNRMGLGYAEGIREIGHQSNQPAAPIVGIKADDGDSLAGFFLGGDGSILPHFREREIIRIRPQPVSQLHQARE